MDSDKSKYNPNFASSGNSGLNRWGNDVFEEFLPILRWPRAGRVYQEMSSNDAVVTAILLTSRELINKVTWRVKDASDSTADKEAGDFLRSCMTDMKTPWSNIIEEITSFFEYGWSLHEITYKKRQGFIPGKVSSSNYDDGRIGWSKIAGRSQASWAGWVFDDKEDELAGMWQETPTGKMFVPMSQAMLFRTTAARNNPEGKSFLRGAYRAWYFKKHIEEIEGIGIERDLAGLPVLKLPEGLNIWDTQDEYATKCRMAAESLVKSIRRDKNEGLVLPFGWDFSLVSAGSGKSIDTNSIINRWDQRIAITMLADIVMLGADKVGSFALANVKKSLLAASLDAQVKGICDTFNRKAVVDLFNYNVFPGITKPPTLEASPVDAPDLETLCNYIETLAKSNMPLFPNINLENHLRSIANLPLTSADDEARLPENRMPAKPASVPGNPAIPVKKEKKAGKKDAKTSTTMEPKKLP